MDKRAFGELSKQVARALNDPAPLAPTKPFDPASVPLFKPAKSVRPCCAFGLDLKAKVGPVPVPGYQNARYWH